MRLATFAAASFLAALPLAGAQSSYDLGEFRHLKVLYAGVPDTSRARVFMEFLKANFDEVGELDVTKLSTATAAPYDVVVCDGKRLYPMDPKKPSIDQAQCSLGPDFTKPILMIASMAGGVQRHTKIGWL
jgi:hypothetical protein